MQRSSSSCKISTLQEGNRLEEILVISEKADTKILEQHINKILRIITPFYDFFKKIHVFSGFTPSEDYVKVPSKIALHRVYRWRERTGLTRLLFHLIYLQHLVTHGIRLLRNNKEIKVVTNSWGHATIGLVVIILSSLLRRKSLVRVAADFQVIPITLKKRYGPTLGWIIKNLTYIAEQVVFKNADIIISVSPTLLKKYPQYAKKILVVANPFPVVDSFCCKKLHKITGKAMRQILYVGRLEPEKGLDVLLRAIVNVKNVRCLIVGDGSLRSEIEYMSKELGVSQVVKFLGAQPQEKVYEIMEHSDMLILPSYTEYTPNVLIEAAAIGLPIIASNVGGVAHIIKDRANGLLFRKGDPDSLREKMLFMMENPDLVKKMREGAKKFVCLNYRTDRTKKIYAKTIQRLLG